MPDGGLDRNGVVLTGRLVSAESRTIRTSGRSLVELKVRVSRPPRRGETDGYETVPVTVWDATLGAALLELAPGTALLILGTLRAREYNTRLYLELVADHISVDLAKADGAPPAPAARPSGSRAAARRDDEVPFKGADHEDGPAWREPPGPWAHHSHP
jgi:hypothetical protein